MITLITNIRAQEIFANIHFVIKSTSLLKVGIVCRSTKNIEENACFDEKTDITFQTDKKKKIGRSNVVVVVEVESLTVILKSECL